MRATICDDFTGGSIFTYDLHPGANEIKVGTLDKGIYIIELEDEEHTVFYKQKIIKD
jgi:hypothetical protein